MTTLEHFDLNNIYLRNTIEQNGKVPHSGDHHVGLKERDGFVFICILFLVILSF